jgi:hypothetical protein
MAQTEEAIKKDTLDPQVLCDALRKEATRLKISVIRIAKATGATRQTVYNWFTGSPVAPYYRDRVAAVIDILKEAQTAEQAWRKACNQFGIQN